jgi:hypothetical protein
MAMTRAGSTALLLAFLTAASAGVGFAQTGPAQGPPAGDPQAPAPIITNSDLNRIRKALDSEPALKIDDDQLRFYVQVLARQPTFAEFVKGYDLVNGPTRRGNPMTHQEFLNMVTPRDLYSSSTITATEVLQFAVTNWLGQTLIRRAIEELREAKSEQEVREIRDRINRELAALRVSGAN